MYKYNLLGGYMFKSKFFKVYGMPIILLLSILSSIPFPFIPLLSPPSYKVNNSHPNCHILRPQVEGYGQRVSPHTLSCGKVVIYKMLITNRLGNSSLADFEREDSGF